MDIEENFENNVSESVFQDVSENTETLTQGNQMTTRAKHINPVTIKMIMDAEKRFDEDNFIINHQTVNLLVFVGQIQSVPDEPTDGQNYLTYEVEDGTGQISVDFWISDTENHLYLYYKRKSEIQGWRKDKYVRVVGTVRPFGNTRRFKAREMCTVDDFNEITYHFLYVLQVHLLQTRGSTEQELKTNTSSLMNNNNNYSNNNNNDFMQEEEEKFSEIQQKVIDVVKKSKPVTGLSRKEILQVLNQYDPSQVNSSIKHLFDEGHLYNTLSIEHFAVLTY